MLKICESLENVSLLDLGFNDNYFKKENVYIHCYEDFIRICDLTNAMKVGKEVDCINIGSKCILNDFICDFLNFTLHNGLDLKDVVELVKNDSDIFEAEFSTRKFKQRGVDVFSPFVQPKSVKVPAKWTFKHIVKAILTGQIVEGKCQGYYTDDYRQDAATNFSRGKEINLLDLAKELTEDKGGWWVRVDDETPEAITLSVNCHHFKYNQLVFSKAS